MARFRRTMLDVEARIYDGSEESAREIREWVGAGRPTGRHESGIFMISTPTGGLRVVPGGYIVKFPGGRFGNCDPETFRANYEPIEGVVHA